MTQEKARQEVERWLLFKRTSALKKTLHADAIQVLQDAIVRGTIEILDTCQIRHTLLFPISSADGASITTLLYRPLLTIAALKARFGSTAAKGIEAHTMIAMYASVLTGRTIKEIDQIDTEDKTIIQSIVCFYL